jgi:hypothetical protein
MTDEREDAAEDQADLSPVVPEGGTENPRRLRSRSRRLRSRSRRLRRLRLRRRGNGAR